MAFAYLLDTTAPVPSPCTARAQRRAERGVSGLMSDFARAAGQGVTFGWGDELEALARSMVGDETYDQELAVIRDEIDAFRESSLGVGLQHAGGGQLFANNADSWRLPAMVHARIGRADSLAIANPVKFGAASGAV